MTDELMTLVGPNSTLQVDSSMKVVSRFHWTDAVTAVIAGRVSTIIEHPTELIRSANLTIARPLVVMSHSYTPTRVIDASYDRLASKTGVLRRDRYICQYCFEYGDTIDHIHPKSRGGGNNWGNLATACGKCNGEKADMTPEEAGMKRPTLRKSYVYDPHAELSEAVLRAFV